jgi:hypothetical protein
MLRQKGNGDVVPTPARAVRQAAHPGCNKCGDVLDGYCNRSAMRVPTRCIDKILAGASRGAS